jgi:LuxR family transcriptional regulator of csgAB operon
LPTIENEAGLSSREMEILALISIGASNEEISEKLYISPHTVKTHLYHIFKKIKVPSRLQAALWAAKNI